MSYFLHSKQLTNVTISLIFYLRTWQASSHVPLLVVVYNFSDTVSYFPMFSGKFCCYKNFQDDLPVCILETLARLFSECNRFGGGGGLVFFFFGGGVLFVWFVLLLLLFCCFLWGFLGSSVILCCSFRGEHHLTPVIYCNGSSSFSLFLSNGVIPFPAISNSGYTFPLSLMKWHPVIRKHLANTL